MSKMKRKILRVIYGLAAAAVFIVPFALAHLWEWVWLAVGILSLVIISELVSVHNDDISISGKFWEWRDKHPKWAALVLVVISLGWTFFIYHLGFG